ncbi:DUF7221 family queuine tRNA-ribosyltransferase-like protein [Ralstonia nicotianae]|uniref:deazapurine DNA modification protein DpdA family protein n=1 Tax=Ralstonia pseudosolanacearum TaxID=1310165 RepID=UPI0020039B48|nr:hypothetical protein [Ralstonia pseudosolanacearum]MCK4118356.1 hypothetical protein [Ralstonia pseudosolanacearum]
MSLVHGIPIRQQNAVLPPGLTMRVGIPHTGGKLAFHAFKQGYPVMVSANAFWRPQSCAFSFPRATDLTELDFALDSAGFTAMKLWKGRGHQAGMAGVFPWTYAQYIELATLSGASWWSQPDLCVEPEIAADQVDIDYRINATATLLEGVLRILYEWQNELVRTCTRTVVEELLKPPVPVIQGWANSDYRRSLDLLQAVWSRWQPWLAPPALIGVGSVCRRSLTHPSHGLYAVLASLEANIPPGSRLHLFGVKGGCIGTLQMLDWIASTDSMAYDFGARVRARQRGIPNTVHHRCGEMQRWMASALDKAKARAGDQFRLSFPR